MLIRLAPTLNHEDHPFAMLLTLDAEALRPHARPLEDRIMSARALKAEMLRQLTSATEALIARHDLRPALAVIQVGDHPASTIYVRHKINACRRTGIHGAVHHLPLETTQRELFALLDELNHDERVHGILVQMPLPEHLDAHSAIQRVDPRKDIDGYHPDNLGRLMAWQGALEPCTPRGIMTLLSAYEVPICGQRAVVVGRSMTVGRPMAQMLMRADATVTVCHRHTRELASIVAEADLLVVATGVPELVQGAWVKPGSVIVDVGITRMEDGSLCGDVEFDRARERCRLITPVPGGVGQMTVATLLENTVRATCNLHGVHIDLNALRAADEP